jgi:outer membrane protein assembly factor BamB
VYVDQHSVDHLYVTDADGNGSSRLLAAPIAYVPPAWSPDGHWLAYVVEAPNGMSRHLFVVDVKSGRRREVERLPGFNLDFAWSPDSKELVFSGDLGGSGEMAGTFVVQPDGSGLRRIARGGLTGFSWSPDGREIVFEPPQGGVWVMNADGSHARPLRIGLPFTGQNVDASWNPAGLPVGSLAGSTVDVKALRRTNVSPLVALSPSTGKVAASAPVLAPQGSVVYSILADGRGGWWVGGDFQQVGGFRCPDLVHVHPDLRVDRSWCPRPSGAQEGVAPLVDRLAASGSTLFVGGVFTRIGGARRSELVAVDERTGKALPWNPRVAGGYGPYVASFAAQGSTLYVTGSFGEIGGSLRGRLGAVDTRTGRATAWNPGPDLDIHGDAPVSVIAPAGPLVFVDGYFSQIGGANRDGFAALEANTGKATPFRIPASDPVVANGKLYVQLPTRPSTHTLAAFDLPSLTPDKRWKQPRPSSDLWGGAAADSRSLYEVVGPTQIAGQPPDRLLWKQVVAYDAGTGSIRWRSPRFYAPQGVDELAIGSSPAYVLVGGNFHTHRP